MELKSSSESRVDFIPDCASDHEEQEVSEDDEDDDRNHKHRRRETRSQSLKGEQREQILSRSNRKRGKPFDNALLSKESDSQSHYNLNKEFPKFEKRRPCITNFSRFPSDANQRFKKNQPFCGELASGRGRSRDFGSWSQRDSRFTGMDIAPQMPLPGPIPPVVLAGRGLHSVSNTQSASWTGGFGLIPGIPNGAIDPIHPLGLQGSFRSSLNPSLNMSIPRQRCKDFEECGFCLRGDMCPMEHGVNHIVVEDVQSLSQFNLPVSLTSAHLLGNPAGNGFGPSVNASSSALINSVSESGKPSKSGIDDDGYTSGGALSGAVDGSGADVYDPDQPLWNNDSPQTTTGLLALQTPAIGATESFMETDPSDRLVRSSGVVVGLQNTSPSVWGRVNASKNRLELREKVDSRVREIRTEEKCEMYARVQGTYHHGKQSIGVEFENSSSKLQNDTGHSFKRPAHKALRTLFVSCIPMKENKKHALLSHFKKFGEVIDIYIPSNSERAFVQFSKREEAERALKSPDAVMGNRFIKLMWANRDSIVDDGIVGGNNPLRMPHHMPEALVSPHPGVANVSKENLQLSTLKACAPCASDNSDAKSPTTNGPNAPAAPLVQRKSENLELLKEELRKKQEMLEQKRKEFRQQLDKLQKHATGVKGEVPEVQTAKRLKVAGAEDSSKSKTPRRLNQPATGADLLAEGSLLKSQPVENVAFNNSKAKHIPQALAHVVSPFPTNRYKLDNRPTAFRVNPPLPTEFGNVNVLRDHFAVFGDLSNVELKHLDVQRRHDGDNCLETAKNLSARVSFKTRQAAERAFTNGKSWNGHSLLLTWLMPSKSNSSQKENSPTSRMSSATELPSLEKPASTNSQDSSGERGGSLSAGKEACSTETQSVVKSARDVAQDSNDGSQNSAPGLTGFSSNEVQSDDRSAVGTSQEASRPGSIDSEVVEEEGGAHGQMELDENFNLNKDPVTGETQEDVC